MSTNNNNNANNDNANNDNAANKQSIKNEQSIKAALQPKETTKIEDHTADNKLPAPSDISEINNKTATKVHDGGGHLELLEERPIVNKERLDVGKVTVSKHARTKTIEVPIELVEEYITVRTEYNDAESQDLLSGSYDDKDILRHIEPSLDSNAVVTINGKQVEIGDEPVEIVLSRQVATLTKDTYAVQEVEVNKTTHTHTDSIAVELRHEELDVNEEGFLEHEASRTHKK